MHRHGRLAPLVAAIDAVIARRRAFGGMDNGELEDRCVWVGLGCGWDTCDVVDGGWGWGCRLKDGGGEWGVGESNRSPRQQATTHETNHPTGQHPQPQLRTNHLGITTGREACRTCVALLVETGVTAELRYVFY